MREAVISGLIAAVLGGGVADAHGPKHRHTAAESTAKSAYRLIVADEGSPAAYVVDLDKGRLLSTLKLKGSARLHRSVTGRYVYAVQPQADQVSVIDAGIALEDHGDHADISIRAPRLLPLQLRGPRPSHVAHDDTRIAVFFDGDGSARVFQEKDLNRSSDKQMLRVSTGGRHHGVALPLGRHLAVSVAPSDEGLPAAIELRDANNAVTQRVDCPRLHGEARAGRFAAFGCENGIVLYETGPGTVTGRHIPYADSLPAGRMIRTLFGGTGFALFVGDFGPDALVIVDPSSSFDAFRLVQLPARRMHFHLHSDPGDKIYVIVEDGTLLSVNALTGAVLTKAQVTGRYAMDAGVVRPRIAAAGPYVVVSNPAAGEVVVLDTDTLAERTRLKFKGTPSDVLAIGGGGVAH
jgi:zinc transport system substrate-binding protein